MIPDPGARSVMNPAHIDPSLDSRAATFENPSGARSGGGAAHRSRKGAPSRTVLPGERVTLADVEGPGVLRHIWMTFLPAPPEILRAFLLEVFYDGASLPSVSVPVLDFFCLPHGRRAPFTSALISAQEGRGFNSHLPVPFNRHVRVELVNASSVHTVLYYQIDYTLQPDVPGDTGYLHAAFRRENPTTMRTDFTIVEGLEGPGRFLGCCLGIRVLDEGTWYGEGEVKIFRDGDGELPTICGTGLEDYVGTAWGMGAHHAPYGGCTLDVRAPDARGPLSQPDFVGLYRFHLPDPVMYARELRVTVQQIGAVVLFAGQEEELARWDASGRLAGAGWTRPGGPILAMGIVERSDDTCATAFVYCLRPQPVPPVNVASAIADVQRRPYEMADPLEGYLALGGPLGP